MLRSFFTLFLLTVSVFLYAQDSASLLTVTTDSAMAANDSSHVAIDTLSDSTLAVYQSLAAHKGFLIDTSKAIVNDVQIYNERRKSGAVFILMILMLALATYLKSAYSKDLEDMIQSMFNRNIAQQIFRTQAADISFSSTMINLNFIMAISLYTHFILLKFFRIIHDQTISAIATLIFLFTFFYFGKIIVLKIIGAIFDVSDVCNEYIFHFTTVCKSLGLALIPVLFVFYTAQEKIFSIAAIASFVVAGISFVVVIWRGLSTAYKVLYRSVYHFFIYVCVVEISPIFLLFKLLTKTIT